MGGAALAAGEHRAEICFSQDAGNLLALVHHYMGLTEDMWGKDVASGRYPWLRRA